MDVFDVNKAQISFFFDAKDIAVIECPLHLFYIWPGSGCRQESKHVACTV